MTIKLPKHPRWDIITCTHFHLHTCSYNLLEKGTATYTVAYLAWSSGSWSTPLSSGTTARSAAQWQLRSMIIDNWQLLPTINLLASKNRSLKSSFSSPLGLGQPSLSASYVYTFQNALIRGHGQHLGGMAKMFCMRFTYVWLSTSLKSWIHHCYTTHGLSWMIIYRAPYA